MNKPVKKAVLPVAGLGTRFLPATKAMPKEMLTVVDKPVIQYAVEEAFAAGIEEILFITGRGKDALEDHFDRPYELVDTLEKRGKNDVLEKVIHMIPQHCRIYYTRQGAPKGLGHAVQCARNFAGNDPFAVLLPDDIILPDSGRSVLGDMIKLYEQTHVSNVLTMDVPRAQTSRYGVLNPGENSFDGRNIKLSGLVEKPSPEEAPSTFAVMGRYIFTPEIFDYLAATKPGAGGEIQLTDAMNELAQSQGFYGHRMNGVRLDCGDKSGFIMANIFMGLRDAGIGEEIADYIRSLDLDQLTRKSA